MNYAFRVFFTGFLCGGLLILAAAIFQDWGREKTIAQLTAERDSLVAVKTPMRETGTALLLSGDATINFKWDVTGDSFIAFRIEPWPPDTLKGKPMKLLPANSKP